MKKLILMSMAVLGLSFAPALAADEPFTDDQVTELEKLMKEYLLNNGDVVMQSVQKFQEEEQVRKMEEAKKTIADNDEYLYNSGSPSFGPKDADVTIVEFFDYNCGYCKKALDELQSVIDADDNVRVVFKEMPILSPASREAAKWALAADKQGKYFEFHTALMQVGAKNAGVYKKIADDLELDFAKLEKDKNGKDIEKAIEKNLEMSQKMGIRGTPAFIIGDEFSPGYIPAAQMKVIIATEREKNG